MQAKVSMVMPCFNKVKYIGRMLRSVYEQTWDNLELILVNDGATDGTRDIIAQWEPRFAARGYDVTVIDQQNAGICRAVLNGMRRITGEYFCCVDCDDVLYPEYVKAMVTTLAVRTDCEWVCCDYEYMQDGEVHPHEIYAAQPGGEDMAENYAAMRMAMVSWIYMVRTSYLRQCHVTENFVVEPGVTQEPCLVMPLAVGGGRLCVMPDVLMRHDISGSRNGPRFRGGNEADWRYFEKYRALIGKVIDRLEVPDGRKRRLAAIARMCFTLAAAGIQAGAPEERGAYEASMREALEQAEQLFPSSFPACRDAFLRVEPQLVRRAAGNRLAGYTPELSPPARVIGYGALGKKASLYLPLSAGTPLEPTLLWDNAATAHSRAGGMPVTPPDYDALRPGDALVLYPLSVSVETDVRARVKTAGVTVVPYGMMADLLAAWHVPLV